MLPLYYSEELKPAQSLQRGCELLLNIISDPAVFEETLFGWILTFSDSECLAKCKFKDAEVGVPCLFSMLYVCILIFFAVVKNKKKHLMPPFSTSCHNQAPVTVSTQPLSSCLHSR